MCVCSQVLFFYSTMMTPPNTRSIWATTTKMHLQRLLTLPGYSWRKKRNEGDKGGVDGIYLAFDNICLSDFLFAHTSWNPPALSPLGKEKRKYHTTGYLDTFYYIPTLTRSIILHLHYIIIILPYFKSSALSCTLSTCFNGVCVCVCVCVCV